MKNKRLSFRQEQIMAVLWENGPMTVSQIQSKLDEPFHYNTVSTFVRGLKKIGMVTHIDNRKPYKYACFIQKYQYINMRIKELIKFYFDKNKKQFIEYLINKEL